MPGPLEREVHALRTAWHAAREEFFPEAALALALALAEKAHAARDGRAYAFACLVRSGVSAYLHETNGSLLCAALREGLVHKEQLLRFLQRREASSSLPLSRDPLSPPYPSPELALELSAVAGVAPEDVERALSLSAPSSASLAVLLYGALLYEEPLRGRCLGAFLEATRPPQRHNIAEEALLTLPLSAARSLYLELQARGFAHAVHLFAYREGASLLSQVRPIEVKGLHLRAGGPATKQLLRWLDSPLPSGAPVWPGRGLWLAHTLAEEHRSVLAPSLEAHLAEPRGRGAWSLSWLSQLPPPLRERAYARLLEHAGTLEGALQLCPVGTEDLLADLSPEARAPVLRRALARQRPLLSLERLPALRKAIRARRVPERVWRRYVQEAQRGALGLPPRPTPAQLLRAVPELDAHTLLQQLGYWDDGQLARELPALAPYLPRPALAAARLAAQRLAHPHERAWALLHLALREGPLTEPLREELLALSREPCARSLASARLTRRLGAPRPHPLPRPPHQPGDELRQRGDERLQEDPEPLLREAEALPPGAFSVALDLYLLTWPLFYDEELERLLRLAERGALAWIDVLYLCCKQGSTEWLRPRAAMLAERAETQPEVLELLLERCPEARTPAPWSPERWAAAPTLELDALTEALTQHRLRAHEADFDLALRARSPEERWLVGALLLEWGAARTPAQSLAMLLERGGCALLGLDRDALAGLLDDFLPPSA